jgi:hypothetical protein
MRKRIVLFGDEPRLHKYMSNVMRRAGGTVGGNVPGAFNSPMANWNDFIRASGGGFNPQANPQGQPTAPGGWEIHQGLSGYGNNQSGSAGFPGGQPSGSGGQPSGSSGFGSSGTAGAGNVSTGTITGTVGKPGFGAWWSGLSASEKARLIAMGAPTVYKAYEAATNGGGSGGGGNADTGQVKDVLMSNIQTGNPALQQTLADPYNVTDAGRTQALEGAERAYQTAEDRIRQMGFASGAGRGGVAKAYRGNVELARGSEMANIMRDFAMWQQQQGDKRLAMLYLPQLEMELRRLGIETGRPVQQDYNWMADLADLGINVADMDIWNNRNNRNNRT